MEQQINWQAWASVALTTFVGGAMSYLAVPHQDLHPKQIVLCAALAGASAVAHLFQQPKLPVEPKADDSKDAS